MRCRACGSSFAVAEGVLDLRVDPSYDTLLDTDVYDRDHTADVASSSSILGVYERLLDERYPPSHIFEEVLEIGSGTGNLTYGLALSRRFRRVHCSDLSPAFMSLLQKRLSELPVEEGGLSYYLLDANRLPFGDATMSLVLGHSVLHHLSWFERTIAEAHRVLSPGGSAIFGDPVLDMHVFVSLAALLILQTDQSIATDPRLDRRQVEALEVIGNRASTNARRLRLSDRDELRSIEDKFLLPINYMRRISERIGFSDFGYSNPTNGVVDVAEVVRAQIVDELKLWEIDTESLEYYSYIFDCLQTGYGEAMQEYVPHHFCFFVFVK